MFIIFGLGNPGSNYRPTRHNLGFHAVETVAQQFAAADFSFKKSLNSEIAQGELNKTKLILVKPQTFMNGSGLAVKKLIKYKPKYKQLIVMHDDLDLPLGKIKIVKNRGTAGHKGVDSIVKELKTKDFIRIRIGIKPNNQKIANPEKFVLKNFTKKENATLNKTLEQVSQIIELLEKEGLAKAMNQYN